MPNDDYPVIFGADGEPPPKSKVRSIRCMHHEWEPVYVKPVRDAALLREYSSQEYEDWQRCSRCQRVSQKRVFSYGSDGKRYTDRFRLLGLAESISFMKHVHEWNDRVAKSDQARTIDLILGKIVLRFASADHTDVSNSPAEIENAPEEHFDERTRRGKAGYLRSDPYVKDELYRIARDFYEDLDSEGE